MTERISLSTIDITRLPIDSIANTPANIVRRRLAEKPMTLRKVLLTIDSISDDLCVVELDDVDSLVPVIAGVPVEAELQSPLLIGGYCRS